MVRLTAVEKALVEQRWRAGVQVASAGPSIDGTYISVWQSGHFTHKVCDSHPFWIRLDNVYDGVLSPVVEIRSKSGQLIRSRYLDLDPENPPQIVIWRETRLGARHDGRARIKSFYKGSFSINIVPC